MKNRSQSSIPLSVLSERLGVPYRSVLRAVQQGRIPAKKVGWVWLVDEKELENREKILDALKLRKRGRPPLEVREVEFRTKS